MKNKTLWYRSKGDLFASSELKWNGDRIREVEFTNATSASVIVRQIEIYWNQGKHVFMRLKISPFKWDKLREFCEALFPCPDEEVLVYSNLRKSISIKWTEHSFINIMTLFNYLNVMYGEKLPDMLYSELLNINNFIQGKGTCTQQHAISSNIPDITAENNIITLFKEYREQSSPVALEKNLKKALIAGENPNQKNAKGETALSVLFLHMNHVPENREMLFLLLFSYGANLWVSVNKVTGYSLVELFKYQQSPEDFAYWEAWMKSPVYLKKSTPVRVDGIDMIATKKAITTTISLNDASILWSELKSVNDLGHDEKKALFPLYSHAFHAREGNILISFEHAFAPAPGKLIDIIRNQDAKIIGANVFILKGSDKTILVYIDLSFLHPDYRGMGIMPLIDFRLPFALQCLYGEHQVSILFLSASYYAIRKVEQTLFFPKYQAKNMENDIKAAFSETYDSPLQWKMTEDNIYWTVREEEQVSVTPPARKMQTPMEIFYFTQLCGSEDRYVPVMVPAGCEMLKNIHGFLAPHQVNFLAHCRELVIMLSETRILTDINPVFENKKPSNRIYESRELFWNQKLIPVAESVINASFSQPEMRHKMNARF